MIKYSTLKSRLNLTFLIGALLFVSCSGDEKNPGGEEEKPVSVPVRFSSGLSGWVESTRATDGSWEANDQVGIYMVPHVAEASAAAGFSTYSTTANTPYVVSGSGASVSLAVAGGQKEMVYPSDGSNVNFVAYYPYQADTHTAKANVYKVDVSNQSSAKAIDLLYHKGTGTAYNRDRSGSVTLAFTHQLSKLKIDLVPASGVEADLTGAALTLSGFPATADFNLSTGVLGNVGGTTSVLTPVKVSSSPGGAAFEAIVVPHGGSSYSRNVRFTINGTSYSYALPASGVFKAGTVHSYKFRFTGSKVEPATETVNLGDGGMVSWGDYQMTAGKLAFDLSASRTINNTVTLSTNAPSALTYILSGEADGNTDAPAWITGVSLSDGVAGNDGWKNYTLTFGTEYNVNPEAAPRTGYIRLEADGLSLPVRVTQTAQAYTVGEPVPASFLNVAAGGMTDKTFTIATNVPDEAITVTTTNTQMITNLTKWRGAVADDGSSTWTIRFNVTANTTTSGRSAEISVLIGGVSKTVQVSQVTTYVNDPVPASFPNVPAAGKTGNTFTIETNSTDVSPVLNQADPSMVTNLNAAFTILDATNGIIYKWIVTFDVSANTDTSARSTTVSVTIGGVTKTVTVSQEAAAVYVNEPNPASFPNVAVAGKAGNTFTLETNAPDETIEVTTTNTQMITNLNKVRTVKDATNGVYTWTVTFNVTANTSTSTRSGSIEVTVSGQKKTVSVSQAAMYVNTPDPASFPNVAAGGKTGNTFTLETNAPDETIEVTTTNASMITGLNKVRTVKDAANGVYTWTVTFNVTANTSISPREGNIEVTVGGQKKTVSVSQAAVGLYVNDPNPASFPNVAVTGATGNTFTLETNSTDMFPILETTDVLMITSLNKERSVKDVTNGIYVWTVTFNVTANVSTSARSGSITVTIGGQTKTVQVSQAGIYANNPEPASFNLPAGGKTGNTFTIETNSTTNPVSPTTTNPSMVTNLKAERSDKDAANGIYVWTVTFDVSANTSASSREATISIPIGNVSKTVSVSQEAAAVYVGEPDPVSFAGLPAGGKTGNTFTIETNSTVVGPIYPTTTNSSMITSLSASRSDKDAANGIYAWTVTFNVSANTDTSTRSADISITIGGVSKTVSVSQVAAAALYVGEPDPASFAGLPAGGKTGNTFTIETNSTTNPVSPTTNVPSMVMNLKAERSDKDAANGVYLWTVTFDVSANTSASPREATISIPIGNVSKTVSVSQVALYVNNPTPASFAGLPAGGKTGNAFTIETNSATNSVSPTTTNPSIITNLKAERSDKDAENGVYVWTVTFDVLENKSASVRSATISIPIGNVSKTVSVSQVAMYVNNPAPASFVDLPVSGKAGNTFTIETNSTDAEPIYPTTTNSSMITSLSASRSVKDAVNGVYLWTMTFDVSENTGTSTRSATISITIGGANKTVSVSQVAMHVSEPNPASFTGLPAGGRTNNTFTITTNSTDMSPVLSSTNSSMITSRDVSHSVLDAANGIYVWTVTFDVSENANTTARSTTVSVSIGGVLKTIPVSQLAYPVSLHDGMANCYKVAPGGQVEFPVLRAYTHTGTVFTNMLHTGGEYTGAFGVEVVWEDVTNLVTPSIISGTGKNAVVRVQANGAESGNAVVKIYKTSDLSTKTPVWSYHIWVTDYTGGATWTNNGFTFMDRNLGATEAALSLAGRGLLYQWGRKDPFPGGKTGTAGYAALGKFYGIEQSGAGGTSAVTVSSSNNADAIVESIQKPTTFYGEKNTTYYDWLPASDNYLWSTNGIASGKKTIYDPCPAGWRVPAYVNISSNWDSSDSPWYGLSGQNFTSGDMGGANWGTNAKYPAAGYRLRSTGALADPGARGTYWSATVTGTLAYNLGFISGNVGPNGNYNRAYGFSVRCVQE